MKIWTQGGAKLEVMRWCSNSLYRIKPNPRSKVPTLLFVFTRQQLQKVTTWAYFWVQTYSKQSSNRSSKFSILNLLLIHLRKIIKKNINSRVEREEWIRCHLGQRIVLYPKIYPLVFSRQQASKTLSSAWQGGGSAQQHSTHQFFASL